MAWGYRGESNDGPNRWMALEACGFPWLQDWQHYPEKGVLLAGGVLNAAVGHPAAGSRRD